MQKIEDAWGDPRGESSVADQVLDPGFLPELALALVGKSVPVGIVVWTEGEAAELVELEPVHHTIGITVLVARQIMGHDLASHGEVHIDLAGGGPVGGRLANPVD